MRNLYVTVSVIFLTSLLIGCTSFEQSTNSTSDSTESIALQRPNILLILADDLGYSDIAPFGGEIPTPNLSALANAGIRFTNFHTAMKCNPTRAMLLTGLDNNFAADGPRTNYQIRQDVPTIAEQLANLGYHTYIAGKWDVGSDPGERPAQRGFERSYVLLPGAGTHYAPIGENSRRENGTTKGYSADGQDVALPVDFYSTDFYTSKLIEFIESGREDGQPFFAFASYTAPHYPLQVPRSYIDRFDGWYDAGYQSIHKQRIKRLQSLGLIKEDAHPWSLPDLPDWEALSDEQKAHESRRMQVYAAMVASLDNAIGKLLEYLERQKLRDNTLVIFASDNGADGTTRGAGFNDTYDNSLANLGSATSYVTQGLNWAKVSSTPWRLVKAYPTEGGTRTPLIAHWPDRTSAGMISDAWFRISDLAPTFLELAGGLVASNEALSGTTIQGRSVLATLTEGKEVYAPSETRIHTYVERRLGGANILRDGWKLTWWKANRKYLAPKLFNLNEDPMETRDLAQQEPGITTELINEWRRYANLAGSAVNEANPE